tara:strand:+ start:3444 stop:4850 length:1407 start_codon:yes stop_codon:yes gene_type:complete
MANPWRVKEGEYILIDDSFANRRELEKHLTKKFKETGFKPKAIYYGKDKIKQRLGETSQKKILADPKNPKLKLQIKVSNPDSARGSDIEGQTSKKGIEGFRKKDVERTRVDTDSYSRIGPVAENLGKMQAHHVRMLQMYRPFFAGMTKEQKAELADFAFNSKYALGNDISNRAMLSEPFHNQIHDFMRERGYQVSSQAIKKGYKYPGVPDLGNTMESRKNALLHFFKNVQEPIEAKLADIKFDQHDAISPMTKAEIDQAVYEFNHPDERLTFDQRKARMTDSKWDWQQNKVHKNIETTELGRPLGGIGDTMKVGGGLRRADQALNLGTNIATGNVAGAAVGGGVLAASEILKNPAAQKAIAGQVARLGASRAGKTMMKTIPGLDILLSGGEAMSYLSQGRLGQAGIATLSGAIGWIPIIGDGAAAALDLTNTGIDISRLQGSPTQTPRKKKTKLIPSGQPTRRLKFGI